MHRRLLWFALGVEQSTLSVETGKKGKEKKVCFCRLNCFQTLYGFKSFFTPKETQEFTCLKLGAVIQNVLCSCARVWVCLSMCFYKQKYFHISCTPSLLCKTKPQRTHHTRDPCLELTDLRVEELIYPHRITTKGPNSHVALEKPTSLPHKKPEVT